MSESLLPPNKGRQERLPQEVAFEHIFPGIKWSSLQKLDLLNTPLLAKRLIFDGFREGYIRDSIESGMEYIERIEIPFLDKFGMTYLMNGVIPTSDRLHKAKITDHLKLKEKMGGMGVQEYFYPKKDMFGKNGSSIVDFSIAAVKGSDLYDKSFIKIIGVLKDDGTPTAVILYREGKKQAKKMKEKVKSYNGSLSLSPAPSAI